MARRGPTLCSAAPRAWMQLLSRSLYRRRGGAFEWTGLSGEASAADSWDQEEGEGECEEGVEGREDIEARHVDGEGRRSEDGVGCGRHCARHGGGGGVVVGRRRGEVAEQRPVQEHEGDLDGGGDQDPA